MPNANFANPDLIPNLAPHDSHSKSVGDDSR